MKPVKININTIQTRIIEVPLFWKFANNPNQAFMLIDDKNCLQVYQGKWDSFCMPELRGMKLDWLTWDQQIIPISEAEFKLMFVKVSLEIEKLSN